MTDANPPITFEIVEQKRRAFARTLKAFREAGGDYEHPAVELPPAKLEGCQVLASRLHLLDLLPKGGVMAEVGVDRGDFSAEILDRCAPRHLHLFDIDESRIANPRILAALAQTDGNVTKHIGDSSQMMRAMPDGALDIIYIDGDHTYEGVSRDLDAALPKLGSEGVLVLNDYAVWSPVGMFHCGVARAVHEFCMTHGWKFRYLALQPMMYNDVMLVRD